MCVCVCALRADLPVLMPLQVVVSGTERGWAGLWPHQYWTGLEEGREGGRGEERERQRRMKRKRKGGRGSEWGRGRERE